MIGTLAKAIEAEGFAVIPCRLDSDALAEVTGWHEAALADADPADISRSASGGNTRVYLARHPAGLERLYLDPLLLALAARVLKRPFRLGAFLSRAVHPPAAAQPLHADCARGRDTPAMLGFIYALDAFRADNGATRFLPRSQRGRADGDCVLAAAPAGSLIVYDGAVHHGFSANESAAGRRSIQGSFVPRDGAASTNLPRGGRGPLARYLLGAPVTLERLRAAIEAGWDALTAYQGAVRSGNPAFGQCYPTARVVQWFFPELEIAGGEVDTGAGTEWHFWNVREDGEAIRHVDLSWQQFPRGSAVRDFRLLDREALNDSPPTVERCALLLERVFAHLAGASEPTRSRCVPGSETAATT